MHQTSHAARPSSTLVFARRAAIVLPLLLALAACGQKQDQHAAAGPAGGGMPPAEVGVIKVSPGAVPLTVRRSRLD